MIIWLASYPKSGNTWVRSFLNSLLFSENNELNLNNILIDQFPNRRHFRGLVNDLDNFNEISKNWITAQEKINIDKKIKFFKTHNILCTINGNNFTNTKNTLGVIHVVRDPRNVITSIKNHYSEKNYDDALSFLFDEHNFVGRDLKVKKDKYDESDILTLIASWQVHYNSWKVFPKNYHLIKYENLIKNPLDEFLLLSKFLTKISNISIDNNKIIKSVKENDFEKLKAVEMNDGFREAVKDKNTKNLVPFFNLGKNNNWKKLLEDKIINKIEKKFHNEMHELNYL